MIWDMAAAAYGIEPKWVPSDIIPSIGISYDLKWTKASNGYDMREVYTVNRDKIFMDFFK